MLIDRAIFQCHWTLVIKGDSRKLSVFTIRPFFRSHLSWSAIRPRSSSCGSLFSHVSNWNQVWNCRLNHVFCLPGHWLCLVRLSLQKLDREFCLFMLAVHFSLYRDRRFIEAVWITTKIVFLFSLLLTQFKPRPSLCQSVSRSSVRWRDERIWRKSSSILIYKWDIDLRCSFNTRAVICNYFVRSSFSWKTPFGQ